MVKKATLLILAERGSLRTGSTRMDLGRSASRTNPQIWLTLPGGRHVGDIPFHAEYRTEIDKQILKAIEKEVATMARQGDDRDTQLPPRGDSLLSAPNGRHSATSGGDRGIFELGGREMIISETLSGRGYKQPVTVYFIRIGPFVEWTMRKADARVFATLREARKIAHQLGHKVTIEPSC